MEHGVFYIKSDIGKFKVNQYGDKEYEFLHMGGKNICVMLKWLRKSPHSDDVELQWLDTYNMHCEMGGINIRKEKTIHLFRLAITLLRKYNPSVKRLTLLDNSKFPCALPDGTTTKPSLKHFYFLFHQKTWYEARFNAYPAFDRERYDKMKENFKNPEIKGPFRFNNPDLEVRLQPLYEESKTWEEFLNRVSKLPNYCSVVYPWYINAVSQILESKAMIPDNWIIDINSEVFPLIPYETIVLKGGGTRRKSRRVIQIPADAFTTPDVPSLSQMLEMKFP